MLGDVMHSKWFSAGLSLALVSLAATVAHPASAAPSARTAAAANSDWSGFYVGVNGGYGVASDPMTTTFTPATNGGYQLGLGPEGWLGGGQIGYNSQFGRWILGVEADAQASGLKDSICFDACKPTISFNVEQKLPWFATVRGRIGYAAGSVLLYGTGGMAFATVKTSPYQVDAGSVSSGSFSDFRTGWTVGGGIESALSDGWSAKFEYLYMDFGRISHSLPDAYSGAAHPETYAFEIRQQLVRLGLNYHFGAHRGQTTFAASPAVNWSGFYVGGNFGYAIERTPTDTYSLVYGTSDQSPMTPRSVVGGVQAGANWQMRHWVLGVEADYQRTHQSESDCGTCLSNNSTNRGQTINWLATARGRVGYAFGQTLYYATGGLALTRVNADYFAIDGGPLASGNFSDTKTGWTLGCGVETALSGNWTAKAEYLFLDFGNITHLMPVVGSTDQAGFSSDIRDHVFRFGVNYHFGA